MANKIQFRRGVKSKIPTASAGEPIFATDTRELFIGTGSGNVNMGGSQWYTGTAMSGTSATTGAYSYSACPLVKVGDIYLNTTYGYVYQCTTAGSGTAAKWTYKGSIKGAQGAKGATGNSWTSMVKSTAWNEIKSEWIDSDADYPIVSLFVNNLFHDDVYWFIPKTSTLNTNDNDIYDVEYISDYDGWYYKIQNGAIEPSIYSYLIKISNPTDGTIYGAATILAQSTMTDLDDVLMQTYNCNLVAGAHNIANGPNSTAIGNGNTALASQFKAGHYSKSGSAGGEYKARRSGYASGADDKRVQQG